MIVVSTDFKAAMKQPIKEIQAFLDAGDFAIRDEDDLISFKVSADSGMCKSCMRKLEAKYLGEHNLVGKWVSAGFGVKLASGAYEYLHYGSFLVSELTVTKDTGTTSIIAYDKMVNAMREYTVLGVEYPIGLYDYTVELCKACDLELGNASFDVHGDLQVTQELWENINGITYRDIFVQIAQATATTCVIGNDDKVYFKPLTATGEQLTYDNMFKLKLEPLYGEINSVVLSRAPQEDNIFLRDEESVLANGLTEFRIENNELLDKDREGTITPIYNALRGISYYPFETTTEGLGWYEVGDQFDIVNDTGDVFPTALFNYSVTIDGGIKETLKTTVESKAQTQYQYAKSLAKRVKNAEIIVNKQENTIQSIVSDIEGVNEKYTQIFQDIDRIENRVQTSGGNNLLKNAVMFSFDSDRVPTDWNVTGDGTLDIHSDAESLMFGGISGHSFTLQNKTVSQVVNVKPFDADNPVYYSFSTRVKKGAEASCYVKIYGSYTTNLVEEVLPNETAFYKELKIEGIAPLDDTLTVEFYSTADGGGATFTDNMLAVGEYASKWTQANGEMMNTQVNFSVDGITVKSSVYVGDYTVMSPLEFAGYSYVNGTLTRVFSLNKDTTRVKKLFAEDEMAMPPIKVVPVTEGDLQGWAFVPYTGGV